METVKRSVVSRGLVWGRDEQDEHRGFSGQWNYFSGYYSGGYVSLSVCVYDWLYPSLCNPMDCRPPGSSVHGIFQARILARVAISFLRSSRPRDWTHVSCISCNGRRVLYQLSHYMSLCAVLCLVTQLCLTLWDPMDCSPPGSSVHGHSPGKNTGVGCRALLQDMSLYIQTHRVHQKWT